MGKKYTVKWRLAVDEYERDELVLTNSYVTGDLGEGPILVTGGDVYTDWREFPEAADGQAIFITVIGPSSDGENVYGVPLVVSEKNCTSGQCTDDNEENGDGDDFVESAGFFIGLGAGNGESPAGILSFHESIPSIALATLQTLNFGINRDVVSVVTNADQTIHLAAPTLLARIVVTNDYAYWIHCSVTNGGAFLTNAPFISHLIVNPNGSTNTNTLQHVRFVGGAAITNEFVCEVATEVTNIWRRIAGNGLKGERITKILDTNAQTRLESLTIFTPATSQQLYRRDRLYWTALGTDLLLSETIDPSGLSLMTTNTYDATGHLLLSIQADGSWIRHDYDGDGLRIRTVQPLTNQPPTASTNACRVMEFGYGTIASSPDSSSAQLGRPRTVMHLIGGLAVSKTMFACPSDNETYTAIAATTASGWTDSSNQISRIKLDNLRRFERLENPDGTYTTYIYTTNGTGRLTTINSWDSTGTQFQQEEQQANSLGRMVSVNVTNTPSSILIDQQLWSDPDEFLRPTKVSYLDGTTEISVKEGCCNIAHSFDRDGVATTNRFDALKRLVASTRLGITASNILDAADRATAIVRKSTSGNSITLRAVGYDPAGRVIRETNALGAVTSYGYSVDAYSQSVSTLTNADGGIRIETRFRDGTLASITGTAVYPVRYIYGATNESSVPRAYSLAIKLDTSGNDTLEWEQTFFDNAGRPYKTLYPGGSSPYRQSYYNFKGQLWKERDPDGVVKLYTNNVRGLLEYTCIDSNRNDRIDLGGQDRVTQVVSDVVSAHGTNVLRNRTYVWLTDGNSTGTLLSTAERSVEGFKNWQDVAGITVSSAKTLPSGGSYTINATNANGAYTVRSFQSGRLVSDASYDSAGGQIAQTTFSYDSEGRRSTSTDARNGATTYAFDDADRIVSVTSPAPGTVGGGAQTVTSIYDTMGRATNVVQADGTSVVSVFAPRGDLLRTSGSRTYPVGYAYDSQGRMVRMTNWTTFSSSAGARVTAWNYDVFRGWLTNKAYEGGSGTTYLYTEAGRLRARIWARGVITTNTFNAFGDLEIVTYNDGTPAVTNTYTRRAQLDNIIKGTDKWRLFYNTAGQLLSEAGNAGTLNGLRVTNVFNDLLQRTNTSSANGATVLTANGYTYDTAGRLSTARDGTFSAGYSYLANSLLVGQIEFKSNTTVRLTTTKSYDKLNRLTSMTSIGGASTAFPVSYAYSYNDANQRGRSTLADGSYWIYQYDSLGQVLSGKRYWSDDIPVAGQQFEYGFDDIGNRLSTKSGGDQYGAGLRLANYTNNSLNQITSRDVPGYLNAIGVATATATNVNVNGTMSYRRGEYYWVEIAPNNSSTAVWQSMTNRAVQNGTTNSVTGNLFLPKAPEVFAYDADGNLTNDGRWAYAWDGENRLIRQFAPTSGPSGSVKALSYSYDWQGRRISKTVSNYSGSAWIKVLDEKFLYDGWNLIGSINASNNAIVGSFLWGSDLSGSMQGAGGVGGLLAVNANGASVSFTAYDGNGNISGLFNAADGAVAGNYEYGPFGEAIRSSGAASRTNPFRFSTKFQDDETDLLYYGYRYYSQSLGRWLSRDPIEEEGGIQLYGMLDNQPIGNIEILGLEKLLIDRINCLGHACAGGAGSLQPFTDTLDTVLRGYGWKCKKTSFSGGDKCKCDCSTQEAAVVYVYIRQPPNWGTMDGKEQKKFTADVKKSLKGIDLWDEYTWDKDKSPIDAHAIRRNCNSKSGSATAWDYFSGESPKNPDFSYPVTGSLKNPSEYWSDKSRVLLTMCCTRSKK